SQMRSSRTTAPCPSEKDSLGREKYFRRSMKWLTVDAPLERGSAADGRRDRVSAGDFGAAARVIPPGHGDRNGIEHDEEHQGGVRGAREFEGRAEALGNEEAAVGPHGAAETEHGGGFLGAFGVGARLAARPACGMAALGQRVEDHRNHGESRTVADAGQEEQEQERQQESEESSRRLAARQ